MQTRDGLRICKEISTDGASYFFLNLLPFLLYTSTTRHCLHVMRIARMEGVWLHALRVLQFCTCTFSPTIDIVSSWPPADLCSLLSNKLTHRGQNETLILLRSRKGWLVPYCDTGVDVSLVVIVAATVEGGRYVSPNKASVPVIHIQLATTAGWG